jgi:DNA helicase HerA-like ATPase
MRGYLIVGSTNTGKSTFLRTKLLKVTNKRSIIIYDVNNEHSDLYPYKFMDFEPFMLKLTKVSNAVIAIEEATIFFNNRSTSDELNKLLVEKRHSNNYIFLCFHSLRSVPRFVYDLCNYITIFKTNDSPSMIEQKFKDERINEMMVRIKASANPYYNETLKIY